MFKAGQIVRLKEDPSRGGMITGLSELKRGKVYWQVLLADGTGERSWPEGGLVAAVDKVDPLEELRQGRFTDPDRLRRSLLHHRLTGRLRDQIYSMDTTDTEFHAYQFKPVLKLLSSPSQGLLIADEVGLGKTIEAGLIWTELVARVDASRLLVVCPNSLTEKWRLELRQKFAVDARIVDADGLLRLMRDDAETGEGFAAIASLSSVRPPKDWEEEGEGARARLCRYLADHEGEPKPLIDCLIFDEAHHLRNSETLNHVFAKTAMQVSDYKLLLSATPINLQREDLRNLLSLIDPDTFSNPYAFTEINEENRPLVHARDLALNPQVSFTKLIDTLRAIPRGDLFRIDRQLENLKRELAQPDLKDTKEQRVRIAAMLEEMSLLGNVVNRTRRRDVNELQVKREVDDHRWTMNDDEFAFYSAVSDVVRQHAFELDASERFLLATPQRLIASSLPAACRHWASKARDFSVDEQTDDPLDGKVGPLTAKLAELCQSGRWISRLSQHDTKLETLLKAVDQHWARGDEKVIIFSSFRTTLDYMAEQLKARGIAIEVMHGGIKEERTGIISRFEQHSGPCLLLTSEVGGEGLDMQFCRSLINYDLPWNPMKVEQRIGRIDRIGQAAERINVLSLIATHTIEERIYDRLYRRLLTIQDTLGAFEAVLGREIKDLEMRLLDPHLSGEQKEAEIKRSALAIVHLQQQAEKLEEEAPGLIAHGDMILSRIEASRTPERRIAPDELADYIHEAVARRFQGSRVDDLPSREGLFEVTLSEGARMALRQVSAKAGRTRTQLLRQNKIIAAFERRPGLSKQIEIVTSSHPLTRLAAHIREQAAQGTPAEPVVSIALPHKTLPDLEPGTYLASASRWMVEGAIRIDRLYYAAHALGQGAVDPIAAERLVQAALRTGRHLAPSVDPDQLVATAQRLLAESVEPAFDDFLEEEEARHEDRANSFLSRLDKQEKERTGEIENRLWSWKMSGDANKLRMVPAQEAKLERLRERFGAKREQISIARSRFSYNNNLVGLMVINLQ